MERNASPPTSSTSLDGLNHDQDILSNPPVTPGHSISSPTQESPGFNELVAPTQSNAISKMRDGEQLRGNSELATSSTGESGVPVKNEHHSPSSPKSGFNVPQIRIEDEHINPSAFPQREEKSLSGSTTDKPASKSPKVDSVFRGLTLDIPSGSLGDEILNADMQFSKRGSMLIDGQKVNVSHFKEGASLSPGVIGRRVKSNPSLRRRAAQKILSVDEEILSQKVRTYYEVGAETSHKMNGNSPVGQKMNLRWQDALGGVDGGSTNSNSRATSTSDLRSNASSTGQQGGAIRESFIRREDNELAGGVEDWQDIETEDVDRYGFIIPRSPRTEQLPTGDMKRSPSMREPQPLQRVSTSLLLASESPRRKHTIKKPPSSPKGLEGPSATSGVTRQASKRSILRPASSQGSYQGNLSGTHSRLRYATNKLPHNKGRRLMDEAGDMLTLPPSIAELAEDGEIGDKGSYMRKKESEREEKWRKMARVVSMGSKGSGMIFDFDTGSPKVVERTWKGIPDRWRATAWYAFLSASAKKRKNSLPEEELIDAFHEYLQESSPDDVQIDIDVPRTVNSHIMFRRRYRGGQRLLFRVLHSMSLHFPDTGYVQGMAALAATLLAYYDEEKAFVMLVRLWELRGLDRLYTSGFGGLLEALEDFEKRWLGEGELGTKLVRESLLPLIV